MRNTLFILLLTLSEMANGQNIVPNSGFEEITNCPNSGGRISWAPPWYKSANSPDLFNVCGDFGYSLPLNRLGFQTTHSGDGYAGISTYTENWHGQNTREFLKCTLNYSLAVGEEYYVEYYVSQADSFQFATHNLGVTFTDVITDTGEFGELLCWPDCNVYVENTSANPLSSKTDWVKVSGTFTAHGGERYIHIGNFRTDDNSEIESVGGGSDPDINWNHSYYYIDDVWLSHVDSAHYVSVNEELGINSGQLSVYPNPASSILNVQSDLERQDGRP